MNHQNLEGVVPPLVTPFDEKENLDLKAFAQEVDFLLAENVHGISIGGSTGEGAVLSHAELQELVLVAAERNVDNRPILGGVISNSTRDAVETALLLRKAGATALLVTPTVYHGATEKGNIRFFRDIAKEVEIPIVVYNVIPTNPIEPRIMRRLCEIEQVIGVKQVDPGKVAAMVALDSHMKVFSACDDMLYPTYVAGACGSISAMNTAVPGLCVRQWQAYLDGDQSTAMHIHQQLYRVFQAYFHQPFPGKIKELLQLLGRDVGKARMPIMPSDTVEIETMKSLLRKAGLIEA